MIRAWQSLTNEEATSAIGLSDAEFPQLIVPRRWVGTAMFLTGHVLLGSMMRAYPGIGTVHAYLTCAVALWAALRWNSTGIACVAAYVAGADVLWRMTDAQIPWEIAKYLIAALCVAGILRLGRRATWSVLPVAYLIALMPSIGLLLERQVGTPNAVLQSLSFNLSGPLSLGMSAWYMSQLRFTRDDIRQIMINLVAPVLTIAVITLLATHTGEELSFTDESNLATSGGFGPNQVSAVLGLGAMMAAMVTLDPKLPSPWRWFAAMLVPFLGVQSAMTFSRGGLYSLAASLIPALLILSQDRASRKMVLRFVVIGAVLITTVIFPRLNSFTGGALALRFEDTSPSHRADIVAEDLRLWKEHPLLGVGPGESRFEREGESRIAHTEYTRLLSEHGLLGVIALLCLATIVLSRVLGAQAAQERAYRAAFMLWSMTSMVHVGMRIAAIGFVFGLGCAHIYVRARRPSSARLDGWSLDGALAAKG
jgi:hypothetical protein